MTHIPTSLSRTFQLWPPISQIQPTGSWHIFSTGDHPPIICSHFFLIELRLLVAVCFESADPTWISHANTRNSNNKGHSMETLIYLLIEQGHHLLFCQIPCVIFTHQHRTLNAPFVAAVSCLHTLQHLILMIFGVFHFPLHWQRKQFPLYSFLYITNIGFSQEPVLQEDHFLILLINDLLEHHLKIASISLTARTFLQPISERLQVHTCTQRRFNRQSLEHKTTLNINNTETKSHHRPSLEHKNTPNINYTETQPQVRHSLPKTHTNNGQWPSQGHHSRQKSDHCSPLIAPSLVSTLLFPFYF